MELMWCPCFCYPIRKRISDSGASFSVGFEGLSTARGLFSLYHTSDNIVAGLEADALNTDYLS